MPSPSPSSDDGETLLQASAPIDGTSDFESTAGDVDTATVTGEKNEKVEVSEPPWKKEHESAVAALRARFGDIDALGIVRVLISLPEAKCWTHSARRCSPQIKVLWECLTSLHPRLCHRLAEIAELMRTLRTSFNHYTHGNAYSILGDHHAWGWVIQSSLYMSPLDPVWEDGKLRIQSTLEHLEKLWEIAQEELKEVDNVFKDWLQPITSGVSKTIKDLRGRIVKLEDQFQEAVKHAADEKRSPDNDPESLRNPGQQPWTTPPPSNITKSYRFYFLRESFKRRLGSMAVLSIIMAIFGSVGVAGNILSVYKWTSSGQAPLIDSNFWSALSQSNIGIAAIYSVIFPQLQTGKSPVPHDVQWIFNSLLYLSVISAILATGVYPWHGRTSIVAAFISTVTQLSVTLQMILSAGKKIQNLEMRVQDLGG